MRIHRGTSLPLLGTAVPWLLVLVMALGLRLYQISDLSLGNDDLSALSRLQYDSFSELIREGVMPDCHPAGNQVFLWSWSQVFGSSEWSLRIPFLGFGLLSIVLVGRLGTRWFSHTAGLMAGAFMASAECSLFHSLTLRPYMLGICAVLGLAWYLSAFIELEKPLKKSSMAGFSVMGALCGYFHYYAAMLAVVMIVSGWLALGPTRRRAYLLAVAGMALLYLPHLPILLHQAQAAGSGWMGAPDGAFFLRYLGYLFHFSWWFAAGTFAVLTGLVWKSQWRRESQLYRWISLDLALVPISIAVIYSWTVAPIVHFSSMVFAYPFLLLGIFSFAKEQRPFARTVYALGLMALSVTTLVYERHFYEWFYDKGPKEMVQLYASEKAGAEAGWMQMNHPFYLEYYVQQQDPPIQFNGYELPPLATFLAWADSSQAKSVAMGWLSRDFPLQYLSVVERYFPVRKVEMLWPICEYYVFTKEQEPAVSPGWRRLAVATDVSWQSEEGFVSTLEVVPSHYFTDFPEILSIQLDACLDQIGEALPQLVVTIEVNGESRFWQAIELMSLPDPAEMHYIADFSLRTRHIPLLTHPQARLKAYLWNVGKSSGNLLRFEVKRRDGNPRIYAFVEKVE